MKARIDQRLLLGESLKLLAMEHGTTALKVSIMVRGVPGRQRRGHEESRTCYWAGHHYIDWPKRHNFYANVSKYLLTRTFFGKKDSKL